MAAQEPHEASPAVLPDVVHNDILVPWRRSPFPLEWPLLFARHAPLQLEIGFGDGRFTAVQARGLPTVDHIGLEISGVSVRRALVRVKREALANVRLLKVGATFALRNLVAPAGLDAVVVNFPDPWPKERHHKHRLLQAPFFRLAASRLAAGGEIRFATDHSDYLAFAIAEAAASDLFDIEQARPPAAVFETKYALKWKAQGKPLHYRVFRYRGEAAPEFPPLERPATMPHALLTGRLDPPSTFTKVVLPFAEGYVVLHELAQIAGPRDRWLLRVTVDEPDLKQQLLVAVQRREGDEVIVRLETFGDPIITPTVRGAIHAVTEWLLATGEFQLTARNY